MEKYTKIIVLSTFEEPKTLSDIGKIWFQNKGRLYQAHVMKEIKEAVDNKILIKKDQLYQVNMQKLIPEIINEISLGENEEVLVQYKHDLKDFYITLGDYTQRVYLNFEIIKSLTKLRYQKAVELDLRFLFQIPFFLRVMEQQNKELTNFLIQLFDLEEYVKTIEKLEIQYLPILKETKITDDIVGDISPIWLYMFDLIKKDLTVFEKNMDVMNAYGKYHLVLFLP